MVELISSSMVVIMWLLLPLVLIHLYSNVRLLGVYHDLRSQGHPEGETFFIKCVYIFKCYNNILIPTILYSYISVSSILQNVSNSNLFKLLIFLSSPLLLAIRICANPSCYMILPQFRCRKVNSFIFEYKKDIISFFYGIIATAIILLLALVSAQVSLNINAFLYIKTETTNTLSEINNLFLYYIFLIIITLIGETILYFIRPVKNNGIKNLESKEYR